MDENECKIAIESLRNDFGIIPYLGTVRHAIYPRGCYVKYPAGLHSGFLNEHETGRRHPAAKALCRGRLFHPLAMTVYHLNH